MSNGQSTDVTCSAIMGLQGLDPTSLHRMVVGKDKRPVPVGVAEIGSTLHDPFAVRLLRNGKFPRTAGETVEELLKAAPADDPLKTERSFLLGEGSQIPVGDLAFENRTIRFVITLGQPDVDVMVSTSSPASDSVEVMAWDPETKGFNYYRTADGAWVFAGNSADALREDSEGKGPFESHPSGHFLMKELRFPWVHWHSFAAPVDPAIFVGVSGLEGHRWVREKGDGDGILLGADECEEAVAKPSIKRWTDARFEALRSGAESLRPRRIVEQVVTSPTVNLVSSQTKFTQAEQGRAIDLPTRFFVDAETLSEAEIRKDEKLLGLAGPPALEVPPDAYRAVIEEFNVRVEDEDGFVRKGDTHFAFVVLERALEDIETVKAATEFLLTRRLTACLLMVDFPNPVFSERRKRLLDRAPTESDPSAGPETYSEAMAQSILAAAETAGADSAEQEFKALWDAGDAWPEKANELLQAYYKSLTDRLSDDPQAAFRDWFRLAETHRRKATHNRDMPIFEFPLLLAKSDAPEETLVMRRDGTVG